MLVHWDNVRFHDGVPDVIEAIKMEQLEKYNKSKAQPLRKLPEESHTPKLK